MVQHERPARPTCQRALQLLPLVVEPPLIVHKVLVLLLEALCPAVIQWCLLSLLRRCQWGVQSLGHAAAQLCWVLHIVPYLWLVVMALLGACTPDDAGGPLGALIMWCRQRLPLSTVVSITHCHKHGRKMG